MNTYSRTATLIRYICHNLQQIFVPLQRWQQIFVISWQQIHFRLCVCAFSLWNFWCDVWFVVSLSGFHLPRCRDLVICDLWSWDLVTGILWSVTGAKLVKSDGCRPSNGRGVTSPECRHFQSKKSDRSEFSAGCPKVHSLRLPKNSLRRPKIIWGCPKIVWGG